MHKLRNQYKELFTSRAFYTQTGLGVLFFTAGLILTHFSNLYAALRASNSVNDLLLDNLPIWNVDDVFFEGVIILVAVVILLVLYKPNRIPFLLKTLGLFYSVRAFFIILTHLSPPPIHSIVLTGNFLERWIAGSGYDLFFSAHTGFPFLMALIFWDDFRLRILLLLTSGVFAAAVLLGHLHYSIDVFSAFFITYGIFQLATWLFKKDFALFRQTKII